MKSVLKGMNVRLLTVLVMAVSTCYGQGDTSKIRKAEASYSTGKDYLKEKKTEAAISSFSEAVALHPTDSAYANLGFAYLQKRDDKNALFSLNKAIDLNADYAWALGLRGYLYTKMDAPELSYNDLSRALALNEKSVETPVWTEEVDSTNENPRQLTPEDTTELHRERERFKQLYVTRGTTFSSIEEQCELTIRDYTKVIALYPGNATAYRERGYLYAKLKRNEAAIADFTSAIELDPQLPGALGGRGALYIAANKPDLAIADITKAIKIDPGAVNNYYNRGLACYHKGEFEQAILDFTTVITQGPPNALAYRQRGNLYTYVNKPALAITDLTKAIAMEPREAESYAIRGLAYALKKDYKPAIEDFTHAIRLQPGNASTYGNRALAYKYRKNYQAAIKDYSTMITLDPKDRNAYKARGEIYQLLGKKKLAAADFRKAEGIF